MPLRRNMKRKRRDRTVTRIGPRYTPPLKIMMCTRPNELFAPTDGGGSITASEGNGPQWAGNANKNSFFGGRGVFDPSGYNAMICGQQTAYDTQSSVVQGGTKYLRVDDWSNYALIYQQYKVNRVTLVFTAFCSGGTLDQFPITLYIRKSPIVTDTSMPNETDLGSQSGWIKKLFTANSPTFTWSCVPMQQDVIDSGNLTYSRQPERMAWQDTSNYNKLNGWEYLISMGSNPLINSNAPIGVSGLATYSSSTTAQYQSTAFPVLQMDYKFSVAWKRRT